MEKIIVGIDECYVIEKKTIPLAFSGCGSNTYILGKRTHFPFPNKPYFTIYQDDNGGFHSGHYDMNLKDALKDFEKRTNPDYLKEKESIPSEDYIIHPEDTALEEGLDDFERMEYEYNLIEWEKQHSY